MFGYLDTRILGANSLLKGIVNSYGVKKIISLISHWYLAKFQKLLYKKPCLNMSYP